MTPTPHTLEDVLDLFVFEYELPNRDDVLAFAARFPRYRREIIDFAVTWIEQELLPAGEPLGPGAAQRVRNWTSSFIQNQLFALKALTQAEPSATSTRAAASLRNLASRSGRSLHDIAQASGLDPMLMSKLNSRRIRPETIPEKVSRRIADALGVPLEHVLVVWTGPPRLRQAAYKAAFKPTAKAQEDFAAAVAASSLSPEAQTDLLTDA
jgi:hypothetical protein